jgi:CHAD domain-containing protein
MSKAKGAAWDERSSVAANARRELPRLAAEFFALAHRVLAEDPAPPDLHRVRLGAKRLRYTLELFRPCYGAGFEKRLEALRQVQQLLGEVNDSLAAARLLPKTMRARAFLQRRAEAKAREFADHWTKCFDAPGQERLWKGYLGRGRAG